MRCILPSTNKLVQLRIENNSEHLGRKKENSDIVILLWYLTKMTQT